MKRVLPLLVAVCILVGAFAAPVMAANFNYEDYIQDVRVDGDNDIVTAYLPAEYAYWFLNGYPSGDGLASDGNPATFQVDHSQIFVDTSYQIRCLPIGYAGLDLRNIPSGSFMGFQFSVDYRGNSYNTPQLQILVTYLDEVGNVVGSAVTKSDSQPLQETVYLGVSLDKPKKAVALTMEIIYSGFDLLHYQPGDQIVLRLDSVFLELTISSLYRLQQETGRTNEILGEVEKQLEQNGQKLDDIINGESGIDAGVTDFGSVGNDMQSAGNQANSAIGDGLGTLGDLAGSGAVTSTLAVLGGAIASVFVGNEVTLCGMTFNPFEVLVVVLGAVSLLGLFLAYIFRKRGGS